MAATNFPVLIAATPNTENSRDNGESNVSKAVKPRSKFSEARREEVRGVRSKRACIRCRMLRKPCSAEDPCTRCSAIKNPRLWSSKCTRGRLADVCDLYSARINKQIIKSLVDEMQQTQDCRDVQDILLVAAEVGHKEVAEFNVTSVYHLKQEGQTHRSPVVIVPEDIGLHTSEKLRALANDMNIHGFPIHVQIVISFGREFQTESELQFFSEVELLYRCTRLMIMRAANCEISLQSRPASSSTTGETIDYLNSPQNLAFKSMIEFLAQQTCHSFLKHLEQALINRSLPTSVILVSALMLFFSLDLWEYEFCYQQHVLEQQVANADKVVKWSLPESPADWIIKLHDFSSFMQDLLRCRHITEGFELNSEGIICVPTSSNDLAMKEIFTSLQINRDSLMNSRASFVMGDVDSLSFKHTASMLLSSQPRDLLSGKTK